MAVQVDSFHFPESWLEVRDLAINASLPSDRQAIDPRFPAPEVYARPPSRAVPATAAWPRSLARSEQTATTAWSLQPPSEQQRRSQKSSDASWEVSMPSSSPASPKSRKEFGQKRGAGRCSTPRKCAALNSRAGLGKCGRRRLLYQAVENDSGSDSNNADDKACDHECAHRISPVSHNRLNARILPADRKPREISDTHAERAKASVSTSTNVRPNAPTRA